MKLKLLKNLIITLLAIIIILLKLYLESVYMEKSFIILKDKLFVINVLKDSIHLRFQQLKILDNVLYVHLEINIIFSVMGELKQI